MPLHPPCDSHPGPTPSCSYIPADIPSTPAPRSQPSSHSGPARHRPHRNPVRYVVWHCLLRTGVWLCGHGGSRRRSSAGFLSRSSRPRSQTFELPPLTGRFTVNIWRVSCIWRLGRERRLRCPDQGAARDHVGRTASGRRVPWRTACDMAMHSAHRSRHGGLRHSDVTPKSTGLSPLFFSHLYAITMCGL